MTRGVFYNVTGITLPGMFGSANWIAILAEIIMLTIVVQDGKRKRNNNTLLLVVLIIYTFLITLTNFLAHNYIGHWMFFASILPGIILMRINFDNIDMLKLLKVFLIKFNYVVSFFFIVGIIDFFIGGIVNNLLKNYLYDESWTKMVTIENEAYGFRMFTVIGTPLMNAFYALVMLSLNVIYKKLTGSFVGNKNLIYGVAILAIFATGSRTALFFGVAIVVISELFTKLKLYKVIILLSVFLILINTSLFQETVGNRLSLGYMNDQDARYQLFQMFLNNDFGEIKFFSGGGYNFSRVLTSSIDDDWSTLNFEYPVLMFLYDFGILATFLYYVIFLIRPIRLWIKQKQTYIVAMYCFLFAFLQTCNMAAQFYDFNLQLGFIIVVITQSINQVRTKRIKI
jgi:hypothetical protein